MKWIVLGIVLFILPYTYLTLHYRKGGPAYLPYEDTRARARAGRAGYDRIVASIARPADPPRTGGAAGGSPRGGLPGGAARAPWPEPLLLPAAIGRDRGRGLFRRSAGPRTPWNSPARMSDNRQQPGRAFSFTSRADDIFVVPDCERLDGGLIARSRDRRSSSPPRPPAPSRPARYRVTLVGQAASRAWTLQVH